MKVLVGFIFLIIASVSTPEWMQVFPTLQSASGKTCPKGRSIDEDQKTGIPDKKIADSFRTKTEARLKDMNESYSKLEQQLNSTVDELQTGLTECKAELEQTQKKLVNLLGKCPVKYDGKCFWAIFTGAFTMNQTQASDLCKNEGGNLTGVYSNEHLNQLIMLVLPHAPSNNRNLWIGMTYENKKLKQRDGSLAPSLKWSPGYPRQDGSYYITIHVNSKRTNEGLRTRPGNANIYGAFCEIEI